MGDIRRQWADLPKELVEMISEHLDSLIDILQLRAVCTSWRSSVSLPSFDQEIPLQILSLPFPFCVDVVLSRRLIYRLEVINHNINCSSSVSKGWLIKVGESRREKLKLLQPISDFQVGYCSIPLDLLDLRFVELIQSFKLELANPEGFSVFGVYKVIPFSLPESSSEEVDGIIAIIQGGKLGYWLVGDEYWEFLDDGDFRFDDIIEYKGQLYVVDRLGTVFWIDSSWELIRYSPLLNSRGGRKTLVESCGDLYVVDRFLDGERNHEYETMATRYRNINPDRRTCERYPKTIDIRVYKLDEEWGRWVDVKSLGDQVFVLGSDCSFSISSSELDGGKGNCVYFTDDDEAGISSNNVRIRMFQLEDCSIKELDMSPQCSEIFWPPNVGST
ncbi:putative F-box protein At1g65770 [Ricinus communis]|uniref:Sugar binding protein, putative n=1 Tax=Ricinus communis TaxID=3988 RepID=B9S6Q0_RICCO|nr:putative F-box protein At1g65770 [Ricinus communis]XP_025013570.1 putative F-box protein At1g65770 [Ricinus communis]EEF40656.1 sugar binding protein, putative [Ricinus communis]|eukprot:XP_002521669.1 putative F-box protein At1g65770 [Ricinus communis]